jgi:hypothetical protein
VPWDLGLWPRGAIPDEIAARTDEDAAEVFQRVPGVRPSDTFMTPKYLESEQYQPTVMVFRDGVAVARLMAPRTGSDRELLINSCRGSGITKT